MEKYTDQQILDILRADDEREKDLAFKALYRTHYAVILSFILKNNGTQSDADDLFQDCIIVLYNQALKREFRLTSSISTFLFSICRNLWLKKLRKKKRNAEFTDDLKNIAVEEDQLAVLIADEKTKRIASLLDSLGADCQKILTYFYYERLPFKQIVEKMQLSGVAVAKNKKSNCLKKLRKLAADRNWLV